MKVLVAGATGAIGRPLISALVASRREVIGIATTERDARTLRDKGSLSRQVCQRQYPIIGSGQGVFSFVHVEDAAIATVAALEAEPGVYNVVDDDPADVNIWLPAFARFLGAPAPRVITEAEALRTAGADSIYYAARLRGASNGLAKRKLGFVPRKLEWLHDTKAGLGTHPST